MAVVAYSPGIDYVQGSLAKPKKRDGHKCGDYLIGTHRVAPTQNPDCTRLYIRGAQTYERTGDISANEIAIRERFTAVAEAVKTRANSLEHVTTDQANFLAQKDSPTGKKTMKAYLWKVCGDAYDAEHPRS
jgi:hypothetical protein